MNNQQTYYVNSYARLLADIREISGVPLGTPDEVTTDWVLKEGPKLDRQLLVYLEYGGEIPTFPEWLIPLWERFILTDEPRLLKYLRQLLVFCYKIEFQPTNEQLKSSQDDFVDTDVGLCVWRDAWMHHASTRARFQVSRNLIARITGRCDWKAIVPHHGPGAVFPPRAPDKKTKFSTIYSSIAAKYPYDQYFEPLPSFWEDVFVHGDRNLQVSETILASLVAVPKDSRGPRLICVHPAEAIWIQQGQRAVLEHAIETNPLTRGSIRFTDQTVNGTMALEASLSREFCTLDLSEASDRLSCTLIEFLFGKYTYDILSCSRATHVRLLDGRVHVLNKWAPMGNALCFPVESLVFWALVRAGIYCRYGIDCNDVYVFGDDIIFPVAYYDGVIETLVMAGLKPNVSKTFRYGSFRESCGVDAYKGFNITPLRMRQADISTVSDVTSQLELAKKLRLSGYEATASYIFTTVRRRLRYLPLCNNQDAVGWYEYVSRDLGWLMMNEPRLKWRRSTHHWAVQSRQVKSVMFNRPKDDWYHLLDSINNITRKGDSLSDRCLDYPIPYSERLSYGWLDCI